MIKNKLLKIYKPTSPGLRSRKIINKKHLNKDKPIKQLNIGLISTSGRNNRGKITVYHRGGGHKKCYRVIDFKRVIKNYILKSKVLRLEYDPNRSAHIALVMHLNYFNNHSYILAPQGLKKGDIIYAGLNINLSNNIGDTMPIKNFKMGSIIHNIELKSGKGGQLIRSAGTYAKILNIIYPKYRVVRLSSGERRFIPEDSFATLGSLSNEKNKQISLGKAGVSRWLGRRPVVRGVAMNPVDHPHGGGEGKTSGGRHPVTPWGFLTKGYRTVKKKNFLIEKSRHLKK